MNKKLLATAVAGAVTAPMAAQAIDFAISGHVNRQVRFADDGAASDIQHLDTTASRSRVTFAGSGDLGNGMKVGTLLEFSLSSNQSAAVPLKATDFSNLGGGARSGLGFSEAFLGGDNTLRHSALWFSGTWGRITMGHTGSAGSGAMYQSHSAAWMGADGYATSESCSSCLLRTTAGGTAGTLYSAFPTISPGRRDLIRYDSPAIGPGRFEVSVGNNEQWSVGGYLGTDVGGGNFILGASYEEDNQTGVFGPGTGGEWGVSGSFLFSQGTNIALAYGERSVAAASDYTDFFVGLGHAWGNSAVEINYRTNGDLPTNAAAADAQAFGVGFQHEFPKPSVSVYAGFHHFNVDAVAGGAGIQDMNVFKIGSRIRFQ